MAIPYLCAEKGIGGCLVRMRRGEGYSEEYSSGTMATLELGMPESKKFYADLKSLDGVHPCVKYKTCVFSLLIGCIPSAVVNFAVLKNKENVISHYQILFVSAFSITTTCLIWFGCKLAINPTAINIHFNLILLTLMEILMAATLIIAARSNAHCYPVKSGTTCGSSNSLRHVHFPVRMIKSYSIVEVVMGISVLFGGVIALHIDALLHSPYLYVSIFWVLAACFPSAIASHVASEYPSKCVVEVLIATSSITSPLLFTTSAYLSVSIVRTIDIFKTYPPAVTHFHEVLLLLLMLILLVQAVLTNITAIQCVHYKSQMIMQGSSWNVSQLDKSDYRNNDVANKTLRNFDKEGAWKAVMVQMTQ
ncbi:membrane protein MLC1 isoform X3 [Pseudophryne corroboree]|uniref:membrane protein MLC1 isoform X3 n=1 Tax=Pseudophryne corroboree TaxID=495146 RepID=UPI003081E52A